MNAIAINIILLVFVITTWGYSWVLMKMGLGYGEPFTFATWRCAIGGIALMAYLSFKPVKWPRIRKLPDYIMIGLFQTTLMFGLMLYGMKRVTAGKTSVLLYTMPIWTILLVNFYLKEIQKESELPHEAVIFKEMPRQRECNFQNNHALFG